MSQRKAKAPTIHDERWRKAKALGLVGGRKPANFTPATKQRLYRYAKAGGEIFERAIGTRKTAGDRTYKVSSRKLTTKNARIARGAGYTVIKDRLIIDHDASKQIKVSGNARGTGTFGIAYVQKKGKIVKTQPKEKWVMLEFTLNPAEFTQKLISGEIPMRGSQYSVSIGGNAPFRRVSLNDPEKIAYYLSSITGIDIPQSYDGAVFQPKTDDLETLAGVIIISVY